MTIKLIYQTRQKKRKKKTFSFNIQNIFEDHSPNLSSIFLLVKKKHKLFFIYHQTGNKESSKFLKQQLINKKLRLLTFILLEPKVISLCHQFRARPACTSVQSDQLPITVDWPTSSWHLNILRTGNGQCQKWKVDYSFYEIQQGKG